MRLRGPPAEKRGDERRSSSARRKSAKQSHHEQTWNQYVSGRRSLIGPAKSTALFNDVHRDACFDESRRLRRSGLVYVPKPTCRGIVSTGQPRRIRHPTSTVAAERCFAIALSAGPCVKAIEDSSPPNGDQGRPPHTRRHISDTADLGTRCRSAAGV